MQIYTLYLLADSHSPFQEMIQTQLQRNFSLYLNSS